MFIEGFGISGYRSFGDEIQFIGPCNKINVIIGQNNSGKSNVLRFLNEHYQNAIIWARSSSELLPLSDLDRHIGENSGEIQIAFGLKHGGTVLETILHNKKSLHENEIGSNLIDQLLQFDEMTRNCDIAWFVYESKYENPSVLSNDLIKQISSDRISNLINSDDGITYHDLRTLIDLLGAQPYDVHNQETAQEALSYVLKALSPVQLNALEVTLIDAVREIKTDETRETYNYSGLNIVKELARLERPDVDESYEESKSRFEMINHFVADVIGKPEVRLEIPASEKTIQIRLDGKTLPLENLGTGIHEVIILAIASTLLREQIICIEEPEIHLHPVLQKKLVRFLNEKTSNQYFIATHSASMIDVPDAAVFHVRHDGEQSIVSQALSSRERFDITVDLGYRASDILQTNCILWVEGPSDRIYLNHWLKQWVAENEGEQLLEGVHYTIMFYGGRLLSHLSANDEEVDEFISLRRINQNLAIVIDSDRRKKGQEMNATKQRVRNEFQEGSGFAWETAGREIENYVASEVMLAAIQKVYPMADGLVSDDRYSQLYHFKLKNGDVKDRDIDKVKIAREVVKREADLDVFDLPEKIRRTARFIRQCNDLE